MWQFLSESLLLTFVSGVIGILTGVGISFLIAWTASNSGLDWEFVVPINALIVAFSFSVVTGLLFGLYPARKAAKLDPIEALRK